MSDKNSEKQTGWRGSENLWLDAACQKIVQSGIEGVRIQPIAKQLGLSRTSFYWHFANRDALLQAVLKRWQETNTKNLIARTQVYSESITEAIFHLFDCWIDPVLFDARLDFAIRSWASTSDDIKKTLTDADSKRIAAITNMFLRFDFKPEQAEARALTVYYTQIGYISMQVTETTAERLQKMPTYAETFTGQTVTQSDLNRFNARHVKRLHPAA